MKLFIYFEGALFDQDSMGEDDVDQRTPVDSTSPEFDQVGDIPEDLSPGFDQDIAEDLSPSVDRGIQEESRYQVKKKKTKKSKKSKKNKVI